MKTVIAAVIALSAAAPAFANDQLARSLGVEPGQYSLEQLVALKNASTQEGNGKIVNFENVGTSFGRSISDPVSN